jgi:hypothetical protein
MFEAVLGVDWDKSQKTASIIAPGSSGSKLTFRAKNFIKHGSQMFRKGKR